MKIAVMQPYLFPYIGYFQLIKYADKFVFYDDVDYIKQGWVNRNQILVNKRPLMFTLPLEKASSFTQIKDTKIHPQIYKKWVVKFCKTLEQNYKNAPYFDLIYPIILEIFKDQSNISELSIKSVEMVSEYLELETKYLISSIAFSEFNKLERAERLIEITKDLKGTTYVNMIGGNSLYTKEVFEKKGIKLEFLQHGLSKYSQSSEDFYPGLSIIDVLMNCDKSEINTLLNQFDIIIE